MNYKVLLVLVTSSILMFSCGDKANEKNASEEDTFEIQNPYSAEGFDSSMVDSMGTLVFEDTVHDFGTIKEGEIVEWELSYTNGGKSNILIQSATASCGCTVPEYSREPLAPGAKAEMLVKFNSQGKSGVVEKNVVVETNGFPAQYELTIKANVQ